MTNIVDRLAEDGLIERAPHPTDRRTTLARITPEGEALVAEATASVNAVRFGVGMLGDDEMEELVRLVRMPCWLFVRPDPPELRAGE